MQKAEHDTARLKERHTLANTQRTATKRSLHRIDGYYVEVLQYTALQWLFTSHPQTCTTTHTHTFCVAWRKREDMRANNLMHTLDTNICVHGCSISAAASSFVFCMHSATKIIIEYQLFVSHQVFSPRALVCVFVCVLLFMLAMCETY